ncbi:RpiR family transcriptional regulator [Micromonospora kangleipakensis]|uniref:RpiR family transcriptional regulator n=1 Tax=Micromonospora kangleipakensis TaxID=1077942 RepID=A0A4Q8BG97_9ACTN|nr:MurR/RpiR family transcriptional regulator [Micromonospora kangleipakensis]RZU76778.1 RpiR family transcriptional regulator [Micromonospora kangleipakensis]
MRIEERIAQYHADLSPQERRAADTLIEHLDDLTAYRAAELAALAGVSKATMSRLFRSLGFADFDEVREHLRALRSAGEPRRVQVPPSLTGYAVQQADAIHKALQQPALTDVVDLLAAARRVTVVGWRNSYPVAMHLRQQLAHARADVRLAPLPGQVIGEELADITAGDLIVVVGFRRRPAGFGSFMAEAAATRADLVLLADPTAREHAAYSRYWLNCPISTGLAFDSYAAVMSLVSVIADGVLSTIGSPARRRISGISSAYRRLDEVE